MKVQFGGEGGQGATQFINWEWLEGDFNVIFKVNTAKEYIEKVIVDQDGITAYFKPNERGSTDGHEQVRATKGKRP